LRSINAWTDVVGPIGRPRLGRVSGLAIALGSSLSFGVADFLGGTTSRRIGTLQFIFCTQLIGLVLAAGWVAITADPIPPVATFVAAAGAGLGMTVGLAAFFQAMVIGTMSVVAPVSAIGVVVPIVAGIVRGERPGTAQAVGIVAAVVGIVLASRAPREEASARVESGLGLALLAALGSGLMLWLMAPASRHGVPWALLIARAIPASILVAAVSLRRVSLRPALESRNARVTLVSALLGFSGIALYAFATLDGQLVIVSVLASLYPAVTVLLAYRVLGERLHGTQQLGIAAVLGGVALLST
jgi:drug/metabolite transporter (DMT)-like permease